MTIRYNKLLAYFFMVLGAINVALGGWLLLLRSFNSSLVIGIVLLAMAALYLTRPYFIVESNEVVVPAMIGPLKRTFLFRAPDDLQFHDGTLFVRDDTRWKRVPVRRWMSDSNDWKAMEGKLAAGSPAQTA